MSESVTSSRLSVDPTLPEQTLSALRRTPEEWEKQHKEDQKSSKEYEWMGGGGGVLFLRSDSLRIG
ncbi:hypothetical protein HNR06_000009 [Nocardiopsis arvandica]|uniref:Uncharacterized protein n=1 Tax=Nocardiopsis sinuspersici TaxID=501010 RepID=A0A7Y9X9W5_9ACTN|nr:hypothetical protein [Nocardiopsis sinuspersici]